MLSGRVLCDRMFTCTEESYGYLSVVSVVCCQLELPCDGLMTCTGEPYVYSVCFECCVLSGRSLGKRPIRFTEDSYDCLPVVKCCFC